MKKLLTLFGAVAFTAAPTMAVVACESNANYNDFKSWINAKETFLLYIGADDCDHCKDFDKALAIQQGDGKTGQQYFEQQLTNTKKEYDEQLSAQKPNMDDPDVKETGYGQTFSKINFHTMKDDKYSGIWGNSKWMRNIRDWLVDHFYALKYSEYDKDNMEQYTFKQKAKAYVIGMGTPIFVLIRAGKLVSVFSGFEGATTVGIDGVVNNVKSNLLEEPTDLVTTTITTIENTSTSNSSSGDDSTEASTQNLNIQYNVNYHNYL